MSKAEFITDLRVLGSQATEIGDPAIKAGDAEVSKAVEQKFGQTFISSKFDAVQAPKGSVGVGVFIDRTAIMDLPAEAIVHFGMEMSLDGGATFGGVFVDRSQDPPRGYSLECDATTGGASGETLKLTEASHRLPLPPDQGMGVLVRPSVGAKSPVDIGVRLVFE